MFERTILDHFSDGYQFAGLHFAYDRGMGSTVIRERKAIRAMAFLEWDGNEPIMDFPSN